MLQRIVLYATLGVLMDVLGLSWEHWGFWCILALFMANTWMTRWEVLEDIQEEVRRVRAEREQSSKDTKD